VKLIGRGRRGRKNTTYSTSTFWSKRQRETVKETWVDLRGRKKGSKMLREQVT